MLYASLKTVHLLAIIIWLGGMAFALFFLRPALATLEPAVRLPLMHEVMRRFTNAIIAVSLITLFTGLWMIGNVARAAAEGGGGFTMPLDWKVMSTLGVLMVLIFGHIRFALYKRCDLSVQAKDWPAAAAVMEKVRFWVLVNLAIGVFIVAFTLLH
jgi:uncharacterized membrane protein